MQDIKSVYRPPVEDQTPVLKVTSGCSHNACKFCGMYRDQSFKIESLRAVIEQLKGLSNKVPSTNRLFLTGGDALVLDIDHLSEILSQVHLHLPRVETVSSFARVSNIKAKSDEDLIKLKTWGIKSLTIGLESGWDDVLQRMNKGQRAEDVISQCKRLDKVGITYNFSIILGIAGSMYGHENASITAEVLNRTSPSRVDVAGLTIFPNSDLYNLVKKGHFIEAKEYEMVEEMLSLIKGLKIKTRFDGTHCTVPIRLAGDLPKDRIHMVETLEKELLTLNERRLRRRREKYMKLRR